MCRNKYVCIKRKIREALHILYNLPLYVDNDRALNTKMLDAATWKLWEALEVKPVQDVQDGIRPPRSYEDYTVTLREENIPACVTVNKIL